MKLRTHPDCERQLSLVPPVTVTQLRAVLAQMDSGLDMDRLQDNTRFTDAGADSLDFFNIILEIQSQTGIVIGDNEIGQVNTVAGLVAYLNARMT